MIQLERSKNVADRAISDWQCAWPVCVNLLLVGGASLLLLETRHAGMHRSESSIFFEEREKLDSSNPHSSTILICMRCVLCSSRLTRVKNGELFFFFGLEVGLCMSAERISQYFEVGFLVSTIFLIDLCQLHHDSKRNDPHLQRKLLTFS